MLLQFAGFPVGTTEWQKDGTSEIVNRELYTIETATLSDSGVYKCRGKNIMGTGDWSRIQLDVNGNNCTLCAQIIYCTSDKLFLIGHALD